jgi:hypothetical protein
MSFFIALKCKVFQYQKLITDQYIVPIPVSFCFHEDLCYFALTPLPPAPSPPSPPEPPGRYNLADISVRISTDQASPTAD